MSKDSTGNTRISRRDLLKAGAAAGVAAALPAGPAQDQSPAGKKQ
ncbi:MAG: twin-arginine translocation signal domain-containing protein [Betaproteobacteria bacterium]|nr:MAG: twin-arginine translocation signal domain-containing protein [Betaproteobacteria bacterium]